MGIMDKIAETKARLVEAKKKHHEVSETVNKKLYDSHVAVKTINAEYQALVTDGAVPCPVKTGKDVHGHPFYFVGETPDGITDVVLCGMTPLGVEHQLSKGRHEYEIGCPHHIKQIPVVLADGTKKWPQARGGTMPKHAVESWNEGPTMWVMFPDNMAGR